MEDLRIEHSPQLSPQKGERVKRNGSAGFGEVIKRAIKSVNSMENGANRSVIDFLKGKASIHETMIALQKANISTRLLLTVRNKVIESYREIMHMQF